MLEARRARLPASRLGSNRCFALDESFHGDLRLSFWKGELTGRSKDEKTVGFMHGGDIVLLQSFMGYYARLGIERANSAQVFRRAASAVLAEEFTGYFTPSDNIRDYLYTGKGMPRFDNRSLGWSCINLPVPSTPGISTEYGGTGIYTRADTAGNMSLVLAYQEPGSDVFRLEHTVQLVQSDIPVIAEALCEESKGIYRREIFALIQEVFPEDAGLAQSNNDLEDVEGRELVSEIRQ